MQAKVKYISDKISYSEPSQGELRVVILGRIERWKESLLAVWNIAWLSCGAVFIYFMLFTDMDRDTKLAIFIFLSFWAYYAYRVAYVFLFRRYGSETIYIKGDALYLKRSVRSYGKAKKYFIDNIESFGKVNIPEKSITNAYENSSWVLGGEKIGFTYQGKFEKFGMQLDDKEVNSLLRLLQKYLGRR